MLDYQEQLKQPGPCPAERFWSSEICLDIGYKSEQTNLRLQKTCRDNWGRRGRFVSSDWSRPFGPGKGSAPRPWCHRAWWHHARGHHGLEGLSNRTRHGVWWSRPGVRLFSQLCSAFFSIAGQREESCKEGSRRQHPPLHPRASRASGMLRIVFSRAKTKVGIDGGGAEAGRVGGCSQAGCHLWVSPPGALGKAWVKCGAWKKMPVLFLLHFNL